MTKSLIIVESPAKTKTLKSFLGPEYEVEASVGHVRDLPKGKLGVDVEHDFAPTYQAIADRRDVIKKLGQAASRASTVYLASDPDREGEAIAWHVAEALGLKDPQRIQFNEITRQAVERALTAPRKLNMDLVNAQQARRVLDRLIGYKLSPVLSKKIQRGLSAGRVQSVAVRLICEREREILAFVPREYWSVTAQLAPHPPAKPVIFPAKLRAIGQTEIEPASEAEVTPILAALEGAQYSVLSVKTAEKKRNAPAPFITSTLQQAASTKLGFRNKTTMSVAQKLYEGLPLGSDGVVGLITYMRTDSVRVAAEAQTEARSYIRDKFGAKYVPGASKQFKSKGNAQDAHEAVRPTSVARDPDSLADHLNPQQLKLYRLIWQRFVASQMMPALVDETAAEIAATNRENPDAPYMFRATGSTVTFDGFRRVYTEATETGAPADDDKTPLPPLTAGQALDLNALEPRQHFTTPKDRYTEASLVRALEEQGIGRPSTYAAITQTIQDREYVSLTDKKFYPTDLGFVVTDQLIKHFPAVVDVKFTADMETKLDAVEDGATNWIELLRTFYGPFSESVTKAGSEMETLKPAPVESEFRCPDTGSPMLLRQSRYGPFLGCSNFPKCRKTLKVNAEGAPIDGPDFNCGMAESAEAAADPAAPARDPATLPNATEFVCPEQRGRFLKRESRFGAFLGCSEYPRCRTMIKVGADGNPVEGAAIECSHKDRKGAGDASPPKASRGKSAAPKKRAAAPRSG